MIRAAQPAEKVGPDLRGGVVGNHHVRLPEVPVEAVRRSTGVPPSRILRTDALFPWSGTEGHLVTCGGPLTPHRERQTGLYLPISWAKSRPPARQLWEALHRAPTEDAILRVALMAAGEPLDCQKGRR